MKKTISIFSLIIMLAMGAASKAQITLPARENIPAGSINEIKLLGKTHLKWVHDTECYILISGDQSVAQSYSGYGIGISNRVLTVNDELGELEYELHMDTSQNNELGIIIEDNARMVLPNGTTSYSSVRGDYYSLREFANEFKGLIDELVVTYDSISRLNVPGGVQREPQKRRKYSVSERTDFDFHWGFNNWGDKWYNGLMKLDGAYNLRTSFSSFQLSESYAIIMTNHTKFMVGIGYESDVYKFTNNYVDMGTDGSLNIVDATGLDAACGITGSNLSDWSTRLVTRYVTLPITFEYRDQGILKSFNMAMSVIPGLCFNTSHTGLKHEMERRGRNYQDAQDVSRFLNPYKLDVRFSFERKGLGVFIQVPTLPLFIDNNTKIYPIKIGFFI